MAESSKPSLTLFQRLLLYGTPVLSVTTCCLMVFWVSSRLEEQETIFKALILSQKQFPRDYASDLKDTTRQERASNTGTPRQESFDYYLGKMADLQLQSLRASCLKNEKVCIQGPKGDTGSKGLKGAPGIGAKGSQGLPGNKGEKGEPGNWTASLVAPKFVVVPSKSLEVSVGETVVLKCYADGYPRPMITWASTGSFKETSNGTWVIERVEMHDFGQYYCTATNSLGSTTYTFRLSPKGGTVKVNKSLVAGTNVSLRCSLCSKRGYSLKWKKPETKSHSDRRIQIDGCLLTITNATAGDSGNYTCVAVRDYDGEVLTETTFLTITDPSTTPSPSTASRSHPVVAQLNDDVILKCGLCGVPGFTFTWEKVVDKIKPSRVSPNTKDCTLVIGKVALQDAGNYTCIARFRSQSQLSYVTKQNIPLIVKAPARVTSEFLPMVTTPVGQSIELHCAAAGPPSPEVYWTKGPTRLSDNGTGILRIDNLTLQDSGEYVCHAINYLGHDRKQITLAVAKLEFRARPPALVSAYTSQSVVIDCTASDFRQSGLPFAVTEWTKLPSPLCKEVPRQLEISRNGSLIFSQVEMLDEGFYTCKAFTREETITVTTYLKVAPFELCTDWMLTTDRCEGFRRSTYNSSVYYAVSASNVWDKSKYYHCPEGYHWACTGEGQRIFWDTDNRSGRYVYRGQCGWQSYTFGGLNRYYFRFRDSAVTNAYKHAGHYDQYQIQFGSSIENFAGIVCIKH